jgi:LPXTG-motif cell wall-anchored protein
MRELLLIGAALVAGIAAFVVIRRKSGGDCMP